MKRYLTLGALLVAFALGACIHQLAPPILIPGEAVVFAQTLPYTLTVTWNVDPDATSYRCLLDGVAQTVVTATTCQFPVTAKGAHTVGVTAINPAFVPSESAPGTLAFTLQTPAAPAGIGVK